jgi:4-azaleucine resistance transporter AzlC
LRDLADPSLDDCAELPYLATSGNHIARKSFYYCYVLKNDDVRTAVRDAGVVWIGLLALGIGFGVVVAGLNLPWWLAPTTATLVFAGSAEFVIVGMLAGGASIAAIALTTALVNSRHLFYGLTFPLHRVRGRAAKTYSVFALCDEAYALITSKQPHTLSSPRILWTQVGLHASWALGALIGALIGTALLTDVDGLGFILTALFLVLSIDALRDADKTTAVLAAASCAVALVVVAHDAIILVAMTVFAAALVVRHNVRRKVTR